MDEQNCGWRENLHPLCCVDPFSKSPVGTEIAPGDMNTVHITALNEPFALIWLLIDLFPKKK